MKKHRHYMQHPQFPWLGLYSDPVRPSYMTIGGSGIVGNFGAESPMSEMHEGTWQDDVRAAGPTSGDGAAAGAGITGVGSGVA
jgi:hypothetical protein